MRSLLIIAFLIFSSVGLSQRAYLSIDTNQIRIGEQVALTIGFEYQNPNGNAIVIWPQYDETITKNIEIVSRKIDTERLIDSSSATYLREQQLQLTVFEPGRFIIPVQTIGLNDSSHYTNSATIFVETVEVDTSKGIFDIRPIMTVDYPFSERSKDWLMQYWYWIAIPLGILLLFFLYRKVKSRQTSEEPEVEEEIIPAHIIALETLEKLLAQEDWKSKEKKIYYSELTDTVRTYLENRFNIHAMEQTTREIIRDLKNANISEDDKVYLRKILREADMVKFAKMSPNDEEAFAYLNKSIDFVKRTKQKEEE